MRTYPQRTYRLGFIPSWQLTLILFTFSLVGCSAGTSNNEAQTSPQISNTLSYKALAGEIVVLRANDGNDDSDSVDYQWSQMDGAPVLLGDAKDRNASFLMPPIEDGMDLTFVVDAHHSDGHIVSEMHTVTATSKPHHHHQPPVVTSQYAVFTADKDLDNRIDLYLAMLDGSAVYRLNEPLVPGGAISQFQISPDRRYVAYLADQDTNDVYELYVAHADGSGITKVSGDLVAGGDVGDFAWAPDSSRLAYRATQDTATIAELFVSNVDGTSNERVSGPLVAGGYVFSFAWSPDGTRLAYHADQNTDNVYELFSSRADGTDNARVSGPLIAGGYVSTFAWAPDSSRIAYTARQFTTRTDEIFTSYPDGSSNVRVSHSLPSERDFLSGDMHWAPNSTRIAYRAYYYYSYTSGGTNYFYHAQNLYSARPDGTGATQVSAVPVAYNEYRNLSRVAWAPDSSRIAYQAEQDADDTYELYTSGPDGSGNVRVSGSLVTGGNVYYDFAWAPDSSRIAYLADQITDNVDELFTSDPIGNGNVRVSGSLVSGGNVYYDFAWAPDSRFLAYRADQSVDGRAELFTATADGSLNPRVSGPMVLNGDVVGYVWSNDGTRLVYRADQLVDEQFELFVAAPDGNAVNANISGTLTTNGDVFSFATH